MSLVNDMLNDLEQRRSEQARNDINIDWMTGQKNAKKNRYFMPLLWFLSALLFIIIAVGVWRNNDSANTEALEHLSDASRLVNSTKDPQFVLETENSSQKDTMSLPESETLNIDVSVGQPASVNTVDAIERKKTNVVVVDVMDSKVSMPIEVAAPTPTEASTPAPVKVPVPAPEHFPGKNLPSTSSTHGEKTMQVVRATATLSTEQRDKSVSRNAEELIRSRKLSEAEEILVNETASNSRAIHSAIVLSSLWLSQERFEEAQNLLLQMRQENPAAVELVKIQARLYLLTSQTRMAVDLLMTFSPSMNAHSDYYELLGLSARQEQQYELSVQAYKGLLGYDSSRGDWWVGMAIALDMQGEKQAARSAYKSALGSKKLSQTLRSYAQQRLSVL
ncbi:MAG: hypothetical protein V7459_01200 [Oceanicoccus sp.]